MVKSKYYFAFGLLLLLTCSTMFAAFAQDDDYWTVSEGEEHRWTVYDRYYDIESEDTDVDRDIQDKTIEPIQYSVTHPNATWGYDDDDEINTIEGSFNISVLTNAYAAQIWGPEEKIEGEIADDDDIELQEIKKGIDGETDITVEHKGYSKDVFEEEVLANYTIVFLSEYEYNFLDQYYGEVDEDYYDEDLVEGDMFQLGHMVNFSLYFVNATDSESVNSEPVTVDGSADTESYDVTYNRYAHTDDDLSFQLSTDSTEVTKVKVGIVYQDLLMELDKVIYLTDLNFTSGEDAILSMESDLTEMALETVSEDRIYKGPAPRLVGVYLMMYNEESQDFADNISVEDENEELNTDDTLLGFYGYNARFLEGAFETSLDKEYEMVNFDLSVLGIEDTDMDTDDDPDIKYTLDASVETEVPIEISVPNYLDVTLIAPILNIVDLTEGVSLPLETTTQGVYIPSAINYIYSAPTEHLQHIVSEGIKNVNNRSYDPQIEMLMVGEILSTMSFTNLMVTPKGYNYSNIARLVDDAVDFSTNQHNESSGSYFDAEFILDLVDYYNIETGDGMNVSVEPNIMPYFYDTRAGPTQVGMDAVWSDGMLQSTEISIYQPAISRVRVISIETTEKGGVLWEWVLFILGLFGLGGALGVVYRKAKKDKVLECNPLTDPNCRL